MSNLLDLKPFGLAQRDKEKIFIDEVRKSASFQYKNSPEFKNLSLNRNFNPKEKFELGDLPFLHVSVFKKFDLLSTPRKKIINTLLSSSTLGTPSKVYLDRSTSKKQARSLQKILVNFFGNRRLPFLIFDALSTSQKSKNELFSRAIALRGFLSMSKEFTFLLNENLTLNLEKTSLLKKQEFKHGVVIFGFTWLIYSVLNNLRTKNSLIEEIKGISKKSKYLIHIGGWKKLQELGISKDKFNNFAAENLALSPDKITDVYGMTEQLGTIYPDCAYGHKHMPVYSEILIRDPDSLEVMRDGRTGFIQLISPLPGSYPGISILSDDLGRIIGHDDCPCGRMGKYFVFVKRSPKAELKGCGDTLNI